MIPERLAALIFMNRSMLENILKQEDLLPDLPVRPEQQ